MKRYLALLLLALLSGILFPARTSAQDDYALFHERAGNASLLYRGHKAYQYILRFNGTNYWATPVFMPGEVVYNGKNYRDVLLNIDASRQDLVLRMDDGVSAKVLERDQVRECAFGGRHFLNLQVLYGAASPSGYWEVLYDGHSKVVRRVVKTLENDLEGNKRSQTHFDGEYRPHVFQTFTYSESYCYLSEDGEVVPLNRRRDLLKRIERTERREVRRHIRSMEGSGMLPFDTFCVEVVKYLETR